MQVEETSNHTLIADQNEHIFTRILNNFGLMETLLIFVFSMLGPWWVTYFVLNKIEFVSAWGYFAVGELFFNLFIFFALTTCTYFSVGVAQSEEHAKKLFILIGWSFLPRILMIPIVTILLFTPTFLSCLIFMISALAIMMLILLCQCKAVIYLYGVSQARALMSVITAPLIFVSLVIVTIFLTFAGILNVFI